MSDEQTYEIDLTPPPEKLTILEELATWDVELTWQKPNEDHDGLWYLTNTYTDNFFDDWAIGHLVDDEDELLTSRDREAVTILINRDLEAEDINLRQSAWESEFGSPYHGDGHRHAGPEVNVKLNGEWSLTRDVEKALDIDYDNIDPEWTISGDVVEMEFDWFKTEMLPRDYPGLDPDRFGLFGRQGGHLVYDVYSSDYDAWPLTLEEATQLRALYSEIPSIIKGIEQEIVARLGGYVLLKLWDEMVDEWRDGEEEAKAEALRTNAFERAAWHQANLDAEDVWFDAVDGQEIVWPIVYEEE